jgi:hypothetical protein
MHPEGLLVQAGAASTLNPWGYVFASIVFMLGTLLVITFVRQVNFELRRQNEAEFEKVATLQDRVAQEPEKAKPAWDLAQARLEEYFARNLAQVRIVFAISVVTMALGFVVMLGGAVLGFFGLNQGQTYLASVGGMITQLIGATFIVMYRSIITQSIQYTKTLERINAVGMAVQILDTIPETAHEHDLKSKTKSDLITILVGGIVNRPE